MVLSKYGQVLEEEKSNNAFDTELTEQQELEQPPLLISEEGSGSLLDERISIFNEQSKTSSYELSGEDSSIEEIQVKKRSMTNENKQGDSSSSEESKPQEHSESSESSKSDEDSSSEEVKKIRLVKRSLDSPQESSNALNKNTNGSNSKEVHAMDSKETTVVESTLETTEPTTQDVEAGTKTTDSLSESTTVEEQPTETTEVTDSTEAATTTETTEATEVTQSSEAEPKVTNMEFETRTETETTESDKTSTAEEQQPTTVLTSTTETSTTDSSETDEDESSVVSKSTLPEVEPSNSPSTPEDKPKLTFVQVAMARVNKLSDQIRIVLYNYRITKVVVIPGQTFFPDPMPMQDFKKTFSVGTMAFSSLMCHGLSNFTIEHVNTDVDRMQVSDEKTLHFI